MIKVFVSGCFDILHGGHIEFFQQAKSIGDHLTVSVADDYVLEKHKNRSPSIPVEHKIHILKSLNMVDDVVIGSGDELGLDFKDSFLRIKPNILAVTEDDRYEDKKMALCRQVGAQYVSFPKSLSYKKTSTTRIINNIKGISEIPLRVDFAGGWLDVPRFVIPGKKVVNCAISPLVSVDEFDYEVCGGLGGSAANAILSGLDGIESELKVGVGWQDPAVILETGLCIWESGAYPKLMYKLNATFLMGKMALLWTGKGHYTPSIADNDRNYSKIATASQIASEAVLEKDLIKLALAINLSYEVQLEEGMKELPDISNCIAKKYCGSGWGGYALYVFKDKRPKSLISIEPYLKGF